MLSTFPQGYASLKKTERQRSIFFTFFCCGLLVFTLPCSVISAAQAVGSQPAPAWQEWKAEAAAVDGDEVDTGGVPRKHSEAGNVFNV